MGYGYAMPLYETGHRIDQTSSQQPQIIQKLFSLHAGHSTLKFLSKVKLRYDFFLNAT